MAEALALARDADAVLALCSRRPARGRSRASAGSRVFSAGVERCVALPALRARNVLLTNMQRVAGPVMAEHVLAMMLAWARGLHFYVPERMAARWTRELPPPGRLITLEGKTLLVVGLGGIGTEVAKRAHGLGMRVDRDARQRPRGTGLREYVGLPDELRTLAGAADVVVNATPLTPATAGMFDAKFFAAVKPTRCSSTSAAAERRAGRSGRCAAETDNSAGAGLDVTDPEPLPAGTRCGDAERDHHAAHLGALRRRDGTRDDLRRRTCAATWRASGCCRWWTWARATSETVTTGCPATRVTGYPPRGFRLRVRAVVAVVAAHLRALRDGARAELGAPRAGR